MGVAGAGWPLAPLAPVGESGVCAVGESGVCAVGESGVCAVGESAVCAVGDGWSSHSRCNSSASWDTRSKSWLWVASVIFFFSSSYGGGEG